MDVFLSPDFSDTYERNPLVLIDVGVSGGIPEHWKRANRYLRVIGFEPDARAFSELEAHSPPGFRFLNTALYNGKAGLDLHLARKQAVSSLFHPNLEFLGRFPEVERFEIVATVPIETDSLDHQLATNGIADADFLKVDAQGAELFILQGAQATLRDSIVGVEVEVEFAPLYQNQPLFAEVDAFLRGQGFHLFDLRPEFWKRSVGIACGNPKGQIVFADALYLRDSSLLGDLASPSPEFRKAKILKAMSICILYGYVDYALEILELNSAVLTDSDCRRIAHLLRASSAGRRTGMPYFRGRQRIADFLYRLWRAFEPLNNEPALRHYHYHGWATGVRVVGNSE